MIPWVNQNPLSGLAARAAVALIQIYRHTLSPLLGPRCRFYPSCSEYAVACLHSYRFHVALKKTASRLLRCHPFHPGGVDLP